MVLQSWALSQNHNKVSNILRSNECGIVTQGVIVIISREAPKFILEPVTYYGFDKFFSASCSPYNASQAKANILKNLCSQ